MLNILFLLVSYLIASIPFGLLIGFVYKKDIRLEGSRNIGATNVFRVCGLFPAVLAFLLDGLKGAIPVLLAKSLFPDKFYYLVGAICIIGHTFSVYLKFKGGKAIAITILILYAMNFYLGLFAVFVWITFLLLFGYSSLAGIMMSILLVPPSFALDILSHVSHYEMTLFSMFCCTIILFKHKANISSLIMGGEGKVFRRSLFNI